MNKKTLMNIKILNYLYDNKNSIIIQYGNKNNKGVTCMGYFIKDNVINKSKIYNDPFEVIKEFFNKFK